MAKGGRYLDKSKTRKTGKGWIIALVVLLVLAVILGGVAIAVSRTYNGFLGKISRAEYGENQLDDDEAAYWATYFPDADTRPQDSGEDSPTAEDTQAPEEDGLQDSGQDSGAA